MPGGSSPPGSPRLFRVAFIGAGVVSSVSAFVLFAYREQVKNEIFRLLSFLDRDWILDPLRILSSRGSGESAVDRSRGSGMIPQATMVELRCGLLCCTGESAYNYGKVPLLGSTESLLTKLGFELCDDTNDDDGGDGEDVKSSLVALVQPCESATPTETRGEWLSDLVQKALFDIRDLKHQVEEEEQQQQQNSDGNTAATPSRKAKRINHKVESLKKQRAKLLEKQQQRGGSEEMTTLVDDDEIRDSWMRIARTFNSARLLLFLFSEQDGLKMLAGYGGDGAKGLNKTLNKLSDVLDVLVVSYTQATEKEEEEDDGDDSLDKARDTTNEWEKSISVAIGSRRKASAAITNDTSSGADENDNNGTDRANESIIELTDDSSVSSNENGDADENDNGADDYSCASNDHNNTEVQVQIESPDDRSDEKVVDAIEAAVDPEDEPDRTNPAHVSKRCLSWNLHLDKLMEDLLSTMNTPGEGEGTRGVERALGAMSLDDASDGDLLNRDTAAVRKRSKKLDEQFSLVVGITGSKEYQKRKKYLLSIEKLRYRVEQRIRQGKYRHELQDARLDVYGSCLSGLSLGKNADVDLSLTFSDAIEKKLDFEAGALTAKKYNRHVTDTVYRVKRKLESSRPSGGNPEFRDIEAVPRARVPVIKGVYMDANNPHSEDGSLHFDICLLNDIAVANSGLIKEYSDVDIRVKSLMIAVKRWTKDNQINSAQDNTLSSYTWMNMVIFYLQCIGFVPNLQCPSMMRECNHDMGWGKSRRRQDNINNLNTAYLKWKGQADGVWKRSPEVDETYKSVSTLLYGFFRFYSKEFPLHLYMVSIKRGGKIRLPKTMFPDRASLHLCIEDPFETYDSHFPHDLGTPADEGGSIFISRCFHDSEEHLKRVLFADANAEDGKSVNDETYAATELWPISTRSKNDSGRSRRNRFKAEKRDPNMTLVIEILGGQVSKKEDIIKIFQPFADETISSIVGSSLTSGGRLAFVDYDSVAAVNAALAAHAKAPLECNGKALCVAPKNQGVSKAATKRGRTSAKKSNATEKTAKNDSKKEKNTDRTGDGKTDKGSNSGKGDPDKTLVVQNISGGASGEGIAKIFRPFAERTNSKLLSADLVKKKTVAFIEYDSQAAVRAVLEEHSKRPLKWNGRALSVAQKLPSGWKRREKIEREQQAKVNENSNAKQNDSKESNPTKEHGKINGSHPDSPRQSKKKAPKKAGRRSSGNKNDAEKKRGKKEERKKKQGAGHNKDTNKPII